MLHLTDGICTIKGGLTENYSLLSENFIKIHRKYIVNLKHITSVKPYAVCTSICEDVPIPARNYRAVRKRIIDALVCI
jgi:DNA-binding LytR/AlgR family response regulator